VEKERTGGRRRGGYAIIAYEQTKNYASLNGRRYSLSAWRSIPETKGGATKAFKAYDLPSQIYNNCYYKVFYVV